MRENGVVWLARRRRSCLGLLGAAVLTALWGCSAGKDTEQRPNGDRPLVVVTTGMVADIVRNLGGERVQIRQLMGGSVDPHLYKPTRNDVAQLMEADLVLYNGLMLEGKMVDTLEKLAEGRDGKRVLPLASSLSPDFLLAGSGHTDPHVWLDASTWANTIDVVLDELKRALPDCSGEFDDNAVQYRAKLAEIHRYGTERIATIPESSRVLITSHDAFRYFGRAYGIEVYGIQGLATDSEAGLQRINDLVNLIVQRKVPAIFVESTVSKDNINALIEGAQRQGHEVVVGGELFSDAIGQEGTYLGTYVGMLDHNITSITRSLGGDAPPRGMNNKLPVE
ncbi:MAG TPA: manganese transporter [Planctomycetaceae bacterium]|nr:manganese transporter [Planctomycetaceae bacterium]